MTNNVKAKLLVISVIWRYCVEVVVGLVLKLVIQMFK